MTDKTIAFIDPGPNLVQYLTSVGERLAPDYRPVFFSRHLKSRDLLRRLGQEIHPQRRSGISDDMPKGIRIDPDRLVARLRKTSDRELVLRHAPLFCWLVRELHSFLDVVKPAGVFCWNGSGLAAAIAEQLVRGCNIPILFGENGYLPNTLQLDPEGVNAFASIGRDMTLERIRSLTYSEHEIQEFDALLEDYRAGHMPRRSPPEHGWIRPSLMAYFLQAWEDWRRRPPTLRANRLIPRALPSLPERFAFFPLQVRSDSQLTIHSPLYGNRLDMAIADVEQALHHVAPDLKLVVKLHPADLKKTDYDPLVRQFPRVVWVGRGDVRTILANTACVITVNSTVGIEGMMFGKPVIALGNNFYVREGLVHPVRDRGELATRLDRALHEPPDAELIRQYLRYLYFVAFVRAHWRDYSPASVGNLAERMLELVEGGRTDENRSDR